MAKLTPISREEANIGIAACRADSGHFILSYGDWTACCVEDEAGEISCIVCTSDERCSRYEEFREVQELFNLLQLSPGLRLAPIEEVPEKKEPEKPGY
jgi:hypothetical protein